MRVYLSNSPGITPAELANWTGIVRILAGSIASYSLHKHGFRTCPCASTLRSEGVPTQMCARFPSSKRQSLTCSCSIRAHT
eukprot:5135450-Heterocapsa_arctica.AAC.1